MHCTKLKVLPKSDVCHTQQLNACRLLPLQHQLQSCEAFKHFCLQQHARSRANNTKCIQALAKLVCMHPCIASACSVCVSSIERLSASACQNLAVQIVCCPLSLGDSDAEEAKRNRMARTAARPALATECPTVLVAPLLCIHAATQSDSCIASHFLSTLLAHAWIT